MTGKQAARLVNRLENKGLSVAEIAARVRCTVATIYGWKRKDAAGRRLTLALSENLSALWEEVRDA